MVYFGISRTNQNNSSSTFLQAVADQTSFRSKLKPENFCLSMNFSFFRNFIKSDIFRIDLVNLSEFIEFKTNYEISQACSESFLASKILNREIKF